MELIELSEEIRKKIKEIDAIRGVIKERGQAKAIAIADHDKALAVNIIKLKNGEVVEIDGERIEGDRLQANLLEKCARALCYEQKIKMEVAESDYKSAITNMNAAEAQLCALQSLFRHFKEA